MAESTGRLRADARRNREQIVAAARDVFLEQGVDAPLDEVARRAGVGIATLYRRFPDRHALTWQVALANMEVFSAELDRAAAEYPDAWGALVQLVRRLVERKVGVFTPVLAPELEEEMRGEGGTLKERRDRLLERVELLIRGAQQEGRLRQGITPVDIVVGVVKLSRPLPVVGAELNELLVGRQLDLFLGALRAVELDSSEPLRHEPLTLDEVDRYLASPE